MAVQSTGENRGNFGSSLGFVLAAAGSAIGLGNIWRFPYAAGENGGGAFLFLYLGCVLFFCIPVLFAELAIGRSTQKNPVGAFAKLAPGSAWPVVGGIGVLTGFAILAFYSVIAGWTLSYLGHALTGAFGETMTAVQSEALFGRISGSVPLSIGLSGAFLLLTAGVVQGGISGGIERAAKILMPIFFVLLVGMAVRSVTLEGAGAGLAFLFKPDFSKINLGVFMGALGQALFSLSLGMGAMITYGSYLKRTEKLPRAAVAVAFSDTGIALLAGVIIFPALFAAGGDPSGGPGLVFVVLPTIFGEMAGGFVFALGFYALLTIAALTSTVSLLEVVVSYFVDQRRWRRGRATLIVTIACFLLALPSAYSGAFLDIQNIIFGNYALSIGALFICLFVGWRWGIPKALDEIAQGGQSLPLAPLWSLLVRFVCPIGVVAILVYIIVTGEYH